jgi:AcrR family transcriptional regulator
VTVVTTELIPGKGERTRARLLEIAVRRFAAEGYRRTSVSDVARDAGLTPAAVYAYFSGKEALFEAAVDFDAAALIDEARDAIPAATSVRERLLVLIAQLIERLDAHPLARRVLAGGEPDVIRRLLDLPSLRALVFDTTELLQGAQERGEVRTDVDPTRMAWGLETIVLTLLMGHLQAGVDPGSDRALGALTVLDAALRVPS